MKEILLKIINSNVTFYVFVPLLIVFLNWIKNGHDIKKKNYQLGYWLKKWEREETFIDIAMKMYKIFGMIFIAVAVLQIVLKQYVGRVWSCVISMILYWAISTLTIWGNNKAVKVRSEIMTNGRCKKGLITSLCTIFVYALACLQIETNQFIYQGLFLIILVVWMFFLFKYCDTVFVLENRYADIYIRGDEPTEYVEAGTIKKQGEWIIVNRYINGYDEEIRIKESDIVKINYYGGPIIMVEQHGLIKRALQLFKRK